MDDWRRILQILGFWALVVGVFQLLASLWMRRVYQRKHERGIRGLHERLEGAQRSFEASRDPSVSEGERRARTARFQEGVRGFYAFYLENRPWVGLPLRALGDELANELQRVLHLDDDGPSREITSTSVAALAFAERSARFDSALQSGLQSLSEAR
jgi:hypothetical protein